MTQRYRFGDVEFDRTGFRLTRAGQVVHVEPKVLEVLAHLIENRGRLVEKRELLAAVWGDTAVSEGALTRAVAQLRKAIGDDAREGRYLETVPTRGYRFLADVETALDGAPASERPARRRAWPVFSLALGALAASALAGWWIGHERGRARPRPQPRTGHALAGSRERRHAAPGHTHRAAPRRPRATHLVVRRAAPGLRRQRRLDRRPRRQRPAPDLRGAQRQRRLVLARRDALLERGEPA